MNEIRMTDDKSVTLPTIKMTCSCGWVEKAFADRDARTRAEQHMRTAHTHGSIVYNGHGYTI